MVDIYLTLLFYFFIFFFPLIFAIQVIICMQFNKVISLLYQHVASTQTNINIHSFWLRSIWIKVIDIESSQLHR